MKEVYATIYTKENGKEEFTYSEWQKKAPLDRTYHRLDGPSAVFNTDAGVHVKNIFWDIEGESFTKEEYNQLIREVRDMPLVLRLIDPRKWVREYK